MYSLSGVALHGVSVRVISILGVLAFSFELTVQCDGGSGVLGGAHGWVVSRAGLWGVPPSWVWVVGFSPQILEHPTPICNAGINLFLAIKCSYVLCLMKIIMNVIVPKASVTKFCFINSVVLFRRTCRIFP